MRMSALGSRSQKKNIEKRRRSEKEKKKLNYKEKWEKKRDDTRNEKGFVWRVCACVILWVTKEFRTFVVVFCCCFFFRFSVLHRTCAGRREYSPTFGTFLIKIDSDTNLVASTGTSCEDQPPRKKQKLSPTSTSSCSHSSSLSAIVSSINIAGNNTTTTVNEQRHHDKASCIDNPSTSGGDFGALAKMQEQGTSHTNGK